MAIVENYESEFVPTVEAVLENENFSPVKAYHPDVIRDTIQMGLDDEKQQTKAVAMIKTIINEHYADLGVFRRRSATVELSGEYLETFNNIATAVNSGLGSLDSTDEAVMLDAVRPKKSAINPNPRYASATEAVEAKVLRAVRKHLIEMQESA